MNPANEGVWFLTEFLRAEADNEFECRKVLRPRSLTADEDLWTRKVLQVFVMGDDIDRVQRGLELVWPFLEGSEEGEERVGMGVVIKLCYNTSSTVERYR